MKKRILFFLTLITLISIGILLSNKIDLNPSLKVGQKIDEFNGVAIYYNGSVDNIDGRRLTKDGYNLGLKYQCVEFVKRYYYEALNHKMPDTYGHAKDFFDPSITDGKKNKQRNLLQYTNPSISKPKTHDLLVFSGTLLNKYGHVAIIVNVTSNNIEIIQQNPGPFGSSRETFDLTYKNGKWKIENERILGWLRP